MTFDYITHSATDGRRFSLRMATLDNLRAFVRAQAGDDARAGITRQPWRGVSLALAAAFGAEWPRHSHPATFGACSLDEYRAELEALYAAETGQNGGTR